MNIENFIEKFAQIFDETDASSLRPETNFREIEEWSSLSVLGIIALSDEEYGKELALDELQKVETIQQLYDLIITK